MRACKRRNELREDKRVFANDRRSFRNGITFAKGLNQMRRFVNLTRTQLF